MIELNTIYNEDCLEGMKRISDKSVDMILCDLPYGTTACKWDTIIPFEPLWAQYKRIIKKNGAMVLFGSQPFTSALIMSNLKMFKYEWVWVKTQPSGIALANKRPMKYTENILVFFQAQTTYNKQMSERWSIAAKKVVVAGVQGDHSTINNGVKLNVPQKRFYDPDVVNPKDVLFFSSVPNGGGKKIHPTQKPVDLFEYLIRTYTNESETVLDNCIGSGTTAIACINTNRNYIGFELDQTYFNLANERIEKHKKDREQT